MPLLLYFQVSAPLRTNLKEASTHSMNSLMKSSARRTLLSLLTPLIRLPNKLFRYLQKCAISWNCARRVSISCLLRFVVLSDSRCQILDSFYLPFGVCVSGDVCKLNYRFLAVAEFGLQVGCQMLRCVGKELET